MAASRRVYWDACAWIALIQQEKIRDDKGQIIEDRYSMCRSVIEVAEKGQIEIATSTLSLAEVNKNPAGTKTGEDKIAAFFERDYVLLVNLDTAVGERARELMQAGFAGLKPADACHLASAITASVEEFHTFDTRLLNLNGLITKLDGTKLATRKPDPGGPPMPLLDALAEPGEAPGPKLQPLLSSVAASEAQQPVAAHSEEPKGLLQDASAPKPPASEPTATSSSSTKLAGEEEST
jgi:predicted nucleic acid-binding protein